MTAQTWAWLGLDASVWQTIVAAVAAVGTVGAAVVAFFALRYFRSQTEAMHASLKVTEASLKVTQNELTRQEERWDAQRRREQEQDHAAVRPAFSIMLSDGQLHPANECGMTVTVNARDAIRHVTASVRLDNKDVAGECTPDYWPEFASGVSHFGLIVRLSGVTVDDLGYLRLTYVDRLGATFAYTYPIRVTDVEHLAFARDQERETTLTGDLD